jgi:glycosyltransferase involved in cell wall biosynthesis
VIGDSVTTLRTAGVISTYNQENFVYESILSLSNQVDELVVIDDCSTDNTADVLRSLSIPNLRLILHETNRGVSSSYNEAVRVADGDVIFFQGGDDRSLPGRVHQQLKSLTNSGLVLSFSKPKIIDSMGNALPGESAPEFSPLVEDDKILERLYFHGNFLCAPSAAMRKRDFEAIGGFNPALSYLQDFDLWLKLAAQARVGVSETPVVEYRKHQNNLSRDTSSKSVAYTSRFDAEVDYILGNSAEQFNRETLQALGRCVGLPNSSLDAAEDSLLLALVQLRHSNITQVRRGLSRLFEIVGRVGDIQFLNEFGIDGNTLNDYAQKCDHMNSSYASNLFRKTAKLR